MKTSIVVIAIILHGINAASTRGASHEAQSASTRELLDVIIDPCAAKAICPSSEKPVCVITNKGKAQCIEDVCSDVACDEGYKCYPKVQCVKAPCPPIGECIKDPCSKVNTCPMDVGCSVDTSLKPVCVSTPDGSDPEWWSLIKKNFKGKGLSRCVEQRGIAPTQGSQCKTKKSIKTCFFGDQQCQAVGAFPETRCDCRNGKWKCNYKLKCLISKDQTFN
jgi:hypothetical protein